MKYFFFLFFAAASFPTNAQDSSLFKREWMIQGGDTLPYRLLLPKNYDEKKRYPLVLFLHGGGERGVDNEQQLVHGAGLFLADSNRSRYPAIVVFPQCPKSSYWSNVQMIAEGEKEAKRSFYFTPSGEPTFGMKMTLSLLQNIKMRYRILPNQVYAMGLSMGGMGTFEIVRRLPDQFAGAIAICGGAHPSSANTIKNTAWWIFHGTDDSVVPAVFSEEMNKALKRNGNRTRLTLYPEVNHNSWDKAFAEPDLLKWLFAQKRDFTKENRELYRN